LSEKQKFHPYDEIQVVNLNELDQIGAVSKKPFAVLVWKNCTQEEAEELKDKILDRCSDLIKDPERKC